MYDAFLAGREAGMKLGYFRLKTAWPFPGKRIAELSAGSKFLAVELSMGQMVEDVRLWAKSDVGFLGRPAGGIPKVSKILEEARKMLS